MLVFSKYVYHIWAKVRINNTHTHTHSIRGTVSAMWESVGAWLELSADAQEPDIVYEFCRRICHVQFGKNTHEYSDALLFSH